MKRYPENAINAAASIFEAANGNTLGQFERDEIAMYGLDGIDPELLAKELICTIQSTDSSSFRQTAYWALGKKFDPALLPFFIEALALETQRDLHAAYQIMIALDNLEEPVFSSIRSGYSSDEFEMNRADATAYLTKKTSSYRSKITGKPSPRRG